ncbi:4-(cytidine 5'-diphospho)-2-C-methyl-D-erythritol kinase [Proteiniclasticum sp. C24MP]|uniref:4-(cytidine 5'-diphospho)-2-C-methyl-D-erythritol kinase n=1 Tax=Proteiniclasticum sp. C24MP TaxID=3374101 RepID=UPI00375474F0
MLVKAFAKINLSLDIVGKREDGYHLLEMVMQNVDLHDDVIIEETEEGIVLTCNKGYVPVDERNIAYKAAKLLMDTKGIERGVSIDITKRIPVAAGLAGGSADAAAVLKGMNVLFNLQMSTEELMEVGLKLGADVPYCIVGGTCLCEGIGEIVTPLKPFSGYSVLLVKPSFGVSTKDAYGSFELDRINKHVDTKKLMKAMEDGDLNGVNYYSRNLLENVVLRRYPILKSIKQMLNRNGSAVTLMSGSGPTIYGIFSDVSDAENAAKVLNRNNNEVILTRTI